ncbi:BMP family ABC transporter substrate-binding protein [Candidatus Thorarchaeota archaeon]|nr:MAG: BMP family ABC transporter substrate-binding protein [Candidatus Thorarchaeota archaeon]
MILSSRSSIIGSIIIVVIIFSGAISFVYMNSQYVPPDVAVVVRAPGFGDLSMADQVLTGIEELGGDMVVNFKYFTADNEAQAQTILEQLSASRIYELIVVIGGELSNELQTVAATYSYQKYAFIGGSVVANNIFSVTFAQHEAAFLAGVLAGVVSASNTNRSGTVGIIGSVSTDPTVIKLIAGFKQGFDYANNSLNYSITLLPAVYVGSYNDSDTAEELAKDMFDPEGDNADIIFAPVRASILGIRNAMVYANETWFCNITNREPFIIAAEGNQDYIGLPDIETRAGTSWVLTSVVPRSDLAVYRVINATLWGEFDKLQGETLQYQMKNTTSFPMSSMDEIGVNLTDFEFNNRNWIPNEILQIIQSLRYDIFYGIIEVSDTYPPP